MKNILVTGGTGFLGRHLIPKLKEKNYNVHISNTKFGNLENYEKFCLDYSDLKFDYIFHLAAKTKAGDYALTHQADQWISNQILNTNILKYWVDKQPQAKLIAMGTSCSYTPNIPMKEENYLVGEPENGLYTYAMTKRMLLIGLQAIQKQHKMSWLYFIPSTLYGPKFDLNDNHFIFDLIRNCYNAKYNNKEFVIWGDGQQKRELVYVNDAVDAMIQLFETESNHMFNLGTGFDNSINEFTNLVCKKLNYDYKLVKRNLDKYVGIKEKKLIPEKINLFLKGNISKTSLDNGLDETINYFIKNSQ